MRFHQQYPSLPPILLTYNLLYSVLQLQLIYSQIIEICTFLLSHHYDHLNDAANYNIYNHLLLYILPKLNPKINKNNVKNQVPPFYE